MFNSLLVTSTVDSTSPTTGSIIIEGGIGVKNNLYVGGNLNIGGSFNLQEATIYSTNDSTNNTTGALVVFGGVGVGKNITTQNIDINGIGTSVVIRGGEQCCCDL